MFLWFGELEVDGHRAQHKATWLPRVDSELLRSLGCLWLIVLMADSELEEMQQNLEVMQAKVNAELRKR